MIRTGKVGLAIIYLSGFCLCGLTVIGAGLAGKIYLSPDVTDLLLKLLTIYSVPVGTVLGGIFASTGGPPKRAARPLQVAIALSVIWNLGLLWRCVAFAASKRDLVDDLVTYLERFAAGGTFLISSCLAYYFVQDGHRSKG
jgi:hypothetical protein